MCDNIVKYVRGYALSRKVENCKVFVKSFSGAKVSDVYGGWRIT